MALARLPSSADLPTPALVLCRATGAAAFMAIGLLGACQSDKPATPGMIAGRYIAALGDADMAASAFVGNDLGERDASAHDTLTVISLPVEEPQTAFGQVEVSNSALGPATGIAVSRDGKYAFVAEYRGHAPAGATSVEQLPKGRAVTAIDLTDPINPRRVGAAFAGIEPSAVAVHPDGDLVAVVTGQARQQIVMLGFKDGQFSGEPMAWPLLGLDNDEGRATSIAWHPSGRALAVTLQDRGEVAFYRFKREADGGLSIMPWGAPVKAGRSPATATFTPDGRHVLVNDFRAGGEPGEPGAGMPQGKVSVIRLGDVPAGETAPGETAGHVVVGSTDVGVLPIGLAISHDGRFAATANLRASAFPEGEPRLGGQQPRGGSVSLLALTGAGELRNLGEYAINAVPAGIAFDGRDAFIAVTQFRSFDPGADDGEIAFFELKGKGAATTLQPCDFYVGAGKGPHGVLIIR